MSEDDWTHKALVNSLEREAPWDREERERKSVKEQIDKLLAQGLVDKDPYILVDAHGKVITVDAKKQKDRANKFKEILVRHAKFFHHWFHDGEWADCKKHTCREVLDAVDEEEE